MCPICKEESCAGDFDSPRYGKDNRVLGDAQASQVELERITLQMDDLEKAEYDIQQEISSLEEQLHELNQKNEEITQMISQSLTPKSVQLRDMLESYKRIVQIKQELSTVDDISTDLNTDIIDERYRLADCCYRLSPRR